MDLHFELHDKCLLIVDDNMTNIILVQAILEEEGFHNTLAANSAIEAYELLEKHHVDAILMDIMMPEIDGLEATDAIHRNENYHDIPIIMVTATDDDDVLKKSFELGAIDFVRKPVNQVELLARIKNVLQSKEKDGLIMQHSRFDAMEEIIGMLAHQWRQPLSVINAIIGTLQAQKELGILGENDLHNSLDNIVKHTNELSHMITSFREFFNTNTTPTLSDPNESIHEAAHLIQDRLEQDKITFILELKDMEPFYFVQNLLVQALTSILLNAKEAHQLRKVEDPYIKISSFKQNNKTNIVIEDNAGGIEKSVIEHIFEPYYSTKKEKNGKGLGLYLCKTILTQQLKGKISVSSQDGITRFLLVF